MGQESPIEPWLATDNRAACESPNPPASLRQNDENRWQRKPKALPESSSVPRSRNGRPQRSCSTGWAGRQEKLRPQEKCFFLDSFYRTYQDLAMVLAKQTATAMIGSRQGGKMNSCRFIMVLSVFAGLGFCATECQPHAKSVGLPSVGRATQPAMQHPFEA